MPKHYFFDMDGTLTDSRTKISPQMLLALHKIKGDITVISGASREKMNEQLEGLSATLMAQSGADNEEEWNETLTQGEKNAIYSWLQERTVLSHEYVEDRGCQITYSVLGFEADKNQKSLYDPTGSKRRFMLKDWSNNLIEARVAGTTSIDFLKKGRNKGYYIDKQCKSKGWKKEDCVFYGDALFKGGNDESVIGVIETIAVKNPDDLIAKLK